MERSIRSQWHRLLTVKTNRLPETIHSGSLRLRDGCAARGCRQEARVLSGGIYTSAVSITTTGSHRVFLDSSGFLALIHPLDAHYQEARTCWAWLSDHYWLPVTTNFIIAETHALFLSRLGQAHATAFLRQLPQSTTRIERVTVADAARHGDYLSVADKGFSLTDATSFAS